MTLIAKSPVGLKVTEPQSMYLPEVIFNIGIEKDLESYRLNDRLEYLKEFSNNFDHYKFYADLSNDLNENRSLVVDRLMKANLLSEEETLKLYLKIDQETDLANVFKEKLENIEIESKNTKKAKKEQRPQLTPKPSNDDEMKKKQKQEYVFVPPKLKL